MFGGQKIRGTVVETRQVSGSPQQCDVLCGSDELGGPLIAENILVPEVKPVGGIGEKVRKGIVRVAEALA